ncbi:hypothetical protein [Thermoproteus tenax]|uniref:Uncharacterized protein n=1 Tax=Thermoproteus tenax (strain ATCC 35583 / DSM 2078 / JCM 9277 / NBRC 100435 / Kra 1) TaxID=768679 RepID=G4RMI6_THETK|nr:hypothetical protein [Thermoproteus tenax]CCC80817.1 hypothetical protein TTX_0140 [Thermoproteus tenax Kra 1]
MARHVRLMGLLTSMATLAVSLLYNIAITRKLHIEELGLLTLLNASTAFSLLPNAVLSFALPRIAARDGGLNVRAALASSTAFFAGSAALTIVYLAATWGKMGVYAPLVLSVALATELVTYLSSVAASILMVRDRGRFVFSNLLQAVSKLVAIGAISLLRWSIEAVLWSSVAITAVPALYGFFYSLRYQAPGSLRRYLREIANASWVPLMGFAVNSFRALDATIMGLLGALNQLGLWYLFFILSKPYSFSTLLSNITYGELLSGRKGGLYKDFLMVLALSTSLSLSYVFFEPVFINFLRPGEPQYAAPLLAPLAIWAAANVLGNVNMFISNVMQGVDKRDIQGGEIRARAYLGSLVFYTHAAELVFTAVYLGSIVPLVELAKMLGAEYYAIAGVVAASLLANIAALAFRALSSGRSALGFITLGSLVQDYAVPLALSLLALYFVSSALRLPLVPSALFSLGEIILAVIVASGVYIGASLALSKTFRELTLAVARNLFTILSNIR